MLKQFGLFKKNDEILVFWWQSKEQNSNFGDVITPYLIDKINGKKSVWIYSRYCFRPYIVASGSVLKLINKNAIVWGTGIISQKDIIIKPREILAVRGPLSRKRLLELSINCPEVYGDPGLLLPSFYKPNVSQEYELGIIPHYIDYERVRREIKDKNVLIINMLDPVEKVIDDINRCKRTISSSLHGIIASHAYGIPSVWVIFSDKLAGDNIKFADYFLSVQINPYSPLDFRNKELSIKEMIRTIDTFKEKPHIDTSKLLEVCPFKKS